ncbi:MAG: hypothetical protein V2I97_19505 [Desulfococcaceae bacterium]|jgi:uncharacterized lipoprotein YajG|nr:hypothetical protein [Desulfococcaceae bacterium]
MKKTQTTGFIIFCAASILFTGCTIQYVPTSQYLIEPEMVKEFRGDNKNIRIVNTQTKKDIIVLKKGPSTVNSDLTALTEVASEILTAELEKRGFGFSETSEKILSISVQNIGAEEGLVAVHCKNLSENYLLIYSI